LSIVTGANSGIGEQVNAFLWGTTAQMNAAMDENIWSSLLLITQIIAIGFIDVQAFSRKGMNPQGKKLPEVWSNVGMK